MVNLPPEFILFDTEYTSWEGAMERDWTGPNEYREIVQIGAVRADGATLAERDRFDVLAKPEKNPTLSEFFTRLTGITQDIVTQNGMAFPDAIRRFADWSGTSPIFSWGNDPRVLAENCGFHGIPFPFSMDRFGDVRDIFRQSGVATDGYMSGTIVRAFGEEPRRRGHNALHDARTILDGLRLLAKR